MGARITTKKLAKNVLISVIAQVISLAVSFVMGLIVPKFIDGYSYAYWQLYLLYVSYVGYCISGCWTVSCCGTGHTIMTNWIKNAFARSFSAF